MSTLFISDLHLSPERPELTELAVDFLQNNTQNTTALYILGDLFNTWLGDDVVPHEFSPLIEQLLLLKQHGIEIYFMVGNRDFMLGKDFARRCGGQLLNDPTVIDLYGHEVLLMHGDSLCTDDIAYQRYRRWTRNKILQWCFLHLPQRFRQRISDKIKQKSHQQKQYKSAMIMDVNHSAVEKALVEHKVGYLIHGHTHRPAIHQLNIENNDVYRIVMGDWHDTISSLKCDAQQFNLVDHRISENQSILKLS